MINFHPGFVLILGGVFALVLPQNFRKWIGIICSIICIIICFSLNEYSNLNYQLTYDISVSLLNVDKLSRIFVLIFSIITLILSVYSQSKGKRGESGFSLIYAGSSIGVVLAGDWISLILFWELMAVSSTFLVWLGDNDESKKSSYRYLVFHLFGGNMLLAGAMYFCINGNIEISLLTGTSSLGYWLVLIGVAVNAGIPPLHTWISDSYPNATIEGSVYLSSYTTKVAVYALIRFFAGTQWLVLAGGIMAVFGVCMALIENDLRRLLSYHIVSQVGMMVAALATGSYVGIDGAALHSVFNILYKGTLFMCAGAVISATGRRKISELGGIGRKMPLISACFLIASLAIAGMPFLNGFVSKGLIMEALSNGGYTVSYWLVLLAGIGTWLSITLKINYFVFFGKSDKVIDCKPIPLSKYIAIVITTVLCILTGLFPQYVYKLCPYSTVGHPFAFEHIIEYIGLFIGATIPFAIVVDKMKPHDSITIDFDWIYRRPLYSVVMYFSRFVLRIFTSFQSKIDGIVDIIIVLLNNPGKIITHINEIRHGEEDDLSQERPIGDLLSTFIIILVIGFLVVYFIGT